MTDPHTTPNKVLKTKQYCRLSNQRTDVLHPDQEKSSAPLSTITGSILRGRIQEAGSPAPFPSNKKCVAQSKMFSLFRLKESKFPSIWSPVGGGGRVGVPLTRSWIRSRLSSTIFMPALETQGKLFHDFSQNHRQFTHREKTLENACELCVAFGVKCSVNEPKPLRLTLFVLTKIYCKTGPSLGILPVPGEIVILRRTRRSSFA